MIVKEHLTIEHEKILSIIAPELHSFVEEHKELNELMIQVRERYNEELYIRALQTIGEELNQHFIFEEEFILPKLARYFSHNDAGPIFKLKSDHQTIRSHYHETLELFNKREHSQGIQPLMQKMNLLAYLLMKHIEKEDHYLLPLISLILSKDELMEISKEVEEAHKTDNN
jgi:hemerythrin-like domain-containing protein